MQKISHMLTAAKERVKPTRRKKKTTTTASGGFGVFRRAGLYVRTLRHLTFAQLIQKLDYKSRTIYYRSPLYPFMEGEHEVPDTPIHTAPDLWPGDVTSGKNLMAGDFAFLGRSVSMGKNLSWEPHGVNEAWLYKLHGFSWLADLRATQDPQAKIFARDALSDWIEHCGNFHPLRWHPYPLSNRLCSWLTHSSWLLDGADIGWQKTFMASLVRQANHLPKVLEWDMGGFRLIKNLKAQIFASLCLPSRQSAYLEAEDLLKRELEKQILPDGMQHERSPSYHADVLKDLLDIHAMIIKAGQTPPEMLDGTIDRMSVALAFFRHPDGRLGLFNDSFTGDVDTLDAIQERCGLAETVPSELTYAGYGRLDSGPMAFIFDAGLVTPRGGSALAHADSLSFELSFGEQRVFVNAGARGYNHPKNLPFRETSAHNTLTVAHQSSAEVWGQGKLGRRPLKTGFTIGQEAGLGVGVEAHHDGFRHLGVKHTRRVFLNTEGTDLRGEDVVEQRKQKQYPVQAHFHLHPAVTYKLISNAEVELSLPNGTRLTFRAKGGQIFDAESQYCPKGGEPIPARKLVIRGTWQKGKCVINWGLRTKNKDGK